MKHLIPLAAVVIATSLTSCKKSEPTTEVSTPSASVSSEAWGEADGKAVQLYTLTNAGGTEVKITNYGGIVVSWMAPDRNGNEENILLGFNNLAAYQAEHPFFGALIGRYGNRIAKGKFSIGEETYTLAVNNGRNHLHGGTKGFDKHVWDAEPDTTGGIAKLKLHLLSPDGDEGYPGNLNVDVTYTLTDANELVIEYNATTDKTTTVNLTNHAYFNLTGDAGKSILDHNLTLKASNYTPVDAGLIPTGEIKDVTGTPFDFRTATTIGSRIDQVPGGYDHNWVLDRTDDSMIPAAVLYDSASGRKLEAYTVEPGIQFYSGNFLNGSLTDAKGKKINQHNGLCLETQHFPDSPNRPEFPSTLLEPGQQYHTISKYVVSVE